MGESLDSLMRTGLISQKAAAKVGVRGTRSQNSRMADFDGRSKDEGGRSDKGHEAGSSRHIDKHQSKGSPALAGGKPSKQGGAGTESQPARRAHIDAGNTQAPNFPRAGSGRAAPSGYGVMPAPGGGKPSPSGGKKMGTPKRLKGPIAKQGGQYGGGGRDTQ